MGKETQRQVYEGRKDTNRQDIRGGGDKKTECEGRKKTDRQEVREEEDRQDRRGGKKTGL